MKLDCVKLPFRELVGRAFDTVVKLRRLRVEAEVSGLTTPDPDENDRAEFLTILELRRLGVD